MYLLVVCVSQNSDQELQSRLVRSTAEITCLTATQLHASSHLSCYAQSDDIKLVPGRFSTICRIEKRPGDEIGMQLGMRRVV